MAHNHTFPAVFLRHYSYFHSIPPWWFPIVFPQHSHAATSTMGFPQHSQIIHRVFLEYSYTVPELLLQNSQDNCASTIPTVFPRCSHSVPSLIHYHPIVFRCYSHSIHTVLPWHSHSIPRAFLIITFQQLFPCYSHSIPIAFAEHSYSISQSIPIAPPERFHCILMILLRYSHGTPMLLLRHSQRIPTVSPSCSLSILQ